MHKIFVLKLFIFCILVLISFAIYAGPIADNQTLTVSGYHTGISPGLELLIDKSLAHQKAKETLSLLDNEIKKDPSNTSLLYKKASIYADQGDWNNTIDVLNQIT